MTEASALPTRTPYKPWRRSSEARLSTVGVHGWTQRDERVSRQHGRGLRSAVHEAGVSASGETIMKPDIVLHLESTAVALPAATVLVGMPVAVVLIGLL